jgi:hypothetical protein
MLKKPFIFFGVFIAIYAIIYWNFGEFLPENNGLGWDGSVYADQARKFPDIFNRQYSSYYFNRILPGILVSIGLKIFSLTPTDAHIIGGFFWLDVLLLYIALYYWYLLSKHQKWSDAQVWFSLILLYINYGILKITFFYPTLTDTMSFCLGICMLYYYLKGNNSGLLITGILAAYTFPFTLIYVLVLYLLPKDIYAIKTEHIAWKRFWQLLFIGLFILFSIGVYSVWYLVTPEKLNAYTRLYTAPLFWTLPISVMGVGLIGILPMYYIFKDIEIKNTLFLIITKQSFWLKIVISILIVFFIIYINNLFCDLDQVAGQTLKSFLVDMVLRRFSTLPFIGWLSAIAYFGLTYIVLLINGKNVLKVIQDAPLGIQLLTIPFMIFLLSSETRHKINLLGFAVWIATVSIQRFNIQLPVGSVITGFLLSKIWLPHLAWGWHGNIFEFPKQIFFMNIGPFIALDFYWINLSVISLVVLLYWWYYRKDFLTQA